MAITRLGPIRIMILAFMLVFAGIQGQAVADDRDGVFIHISHGSEDSHRLLMALKMAVGMAEANKAVLVYCDIEAVKVLTKNAAPVAHKGFPSSADLLTKLAELKVVVMACPTCMKVASIEASDLRKGVIVAERDRFFSFTSGRIITLDY